MFLPENDILYRVLFQILDRASGRGSYCVLEGGEGMLWGTIIAGGLATCNLANALNSFMELALFDLY